MRQLECDIPAPTEAILLLDILTAQCNLHTHCLSNNGGVDRVTVYRLLCDLSFAVKLFVMCGRRPTLLCETGPLADR